ncbi:hypothetical protein U1Q18_036376 [Sarracenia purpurea var. burkii]
MVASISVEEEIKSDKGQDLDVVSLDRNEVRETPLVAKGPSLDTLVSRNVVKENKPQAPGVSLPSDQSYRSARLQCSRAPVQAGFSRPAPADLAYCNVTPPS